MPTLLLFLCLSPLPLTYLLVGIDFAGFLLMVHAVSFMPLLVSTARH